MAAQQQSAPNKNPLPPDRQVPGTSGPDAQGPANGVDLGEYISVAPDADKPHMLDTPDGGFIASIGEAAENPHIASEGFYANLADEGGIPDPILERISTDLFRRVEQDKEARAKRVDQYEMAMRRTGLGKDAPGGASFEGASTVVHPMITEACIDYCSRIMKEIYPIAGPVKAKLVGVPTKEKVERADRKTDHMNYQITTQIKEARAVLEQTFTQVPLAGAQYVLQYWDHRLKRPRWQCVPVDQVFIPFSAADFYSSHRRTYAETLPEVDFRQRVDQGMYRDLDLALPAARPERTKAQQANEKIEGKDENIENLDGEREIWTCMSYLEVTDDIAAVPIMQYESQHVGELCPYLVTLDVSTKKVLAIYRDWEEDDTAREPIEHLFEFNFIPWRGALSIGLGQIIDGLSGAATGALRALLDSAHCSTSVTAFVLKGSGLNGQSTVAQIGTMVEVDSGLEADDIRKRVMAPPWNPPSSVMFQLLGFLVESARGVVRTSLDESAIDNNQAVPVGTQLSRVEEGLVVFSAIHGRAHAALNRLLMGLHRLNRLYLPDYVQVDRDGKEMLVSRSDYEGPCDVQPVSDPTIYSDQQRFWQIQALEQSASLFPQIYNIRAIEKRKLALWKVQDPEEVLNDQPQPQELNAVNENLAMALGKPAVAFPDQDHMAHLQSHLLYIGSPILGSNPLIAATFLPIALKHCAEHLSLHYVQSVIDTVKAASGQEAHDLMSSDPVAKAAYDGMLAEASAVSMQQITQDLEPFMQPLQQAMQLMQQMMPKPPMDPAQAAIQAATQETQRKSQDDQAGHSLDQARLAAQEQNDQQRNAANFQRVQVMRDNAQLAAATRIHTTEMDNEAAEQTAAARIASGHPPRFTDGESMGR